MSDVATLVAEEPGAPSPGALCPNCRALLFRIWFGWRCPVCQAELVLLQWRAEYWERMRRE